VVVTFEHAAGEVAELLAGDAVVENVVGLPDAERARALASADVLYAWNWRRELRSEEGPVLNARFVQMLSAGVDHLPFEQLPPRAIVASNAGAYAEPMAEHVAAMALALLKRLPQNHAKLAAGVWNHDATNPTVHGAVCGVLGFGGIGKAAARLIRALGARIHAINTTGRSDEPAEFVGTLEDLDAVLAVADILVIALPLTRRTDGLIGARELSLMKPTATLVNVARGAIIDEGALYEHLRTHPEFSAGIDTWWIEPFSSGEFRVDYPFFDLPNLLGSPHNSAHRARVLDDAAVRGAANILRYLRGEHVAGVVRFDDYVDA
jgi:glycerate dehydrogenase